MFNLVFMIVLLGTSKLTSGLDSYLYLSDKTIKEETPIGSFVVDLSKELLDKNKQLGADKTQQFTLLDDSKLAQGGFFQLDQSSGILTTKRFIDREQMCSSRQCADPCDNWSSHFTNSNNNNNGSCRINLKVLLMPSYNILNLNVFIQDINDNKPAFSANNITQQINENVPTGYKIPIELAFDPDIGANAIQYYELKTANKNSKSPFKLAQNLNESQLYLVVDTDLDRERIPFYNLTIVAYDGGQPPLSASLNMKVELVDINDNSPVFEQSSYRFKVSEDTLLDTIIGKVRAYDLDTGKNGLVKYRFVENGNNLVSSNDPHKRLQKGGIVMPQPQLQPQQQQQPQQSKQNVFKYFDLDELTGVLKLKAPLDYEDESLFGLIVEARDAGVGSLPAYASVELIVSDVNDNAPEVSVSFLNTLFKNQTTTSKYDVYLPENAKANKFLAHVSIIDKDGTDEHGRLDWRISINDRPFYGSKEGLIDKSDEAYLKLIKLNNNSFTLNVGSPQMIDREKRDHFNVSIAAWDYGAPKLNGIFYNFTIRLIDVNDNVPKFDKYTYEESIYENNEPFKALFKLNAFDLDSVGPNSNITYSIKEIEMNDYFYIDYNGLVYSKIKFDRETKDKYVFHVIAEDNGQPPLSSTALVNMNILDVNDNHPNIVFNTSFYHQVLTTDYVRSKSGGTKLSYNLNVKLSENVLPNTRVIDFKGLDGDINENSFVEFLLDPDENAHQTEFKMTSNGHFWLAKSLNKQTQSAYEFTITCKDLGNNPSLFTKIKLSIDVVDTNEYCIKMYEKQEYQDLSISSSEEDKDTKTGFYNRDQAIQKEKESPFNTNLFKVDYILPNEKLNKLEYNTNSEESTIIFELLTHKDLVELKTYKLNNDNNPTNVKLQRLEISFKSTLSKQNISRLMLGKYTIKVKLIDELNPTCVRIEPFTLLIGNNFIGRKEMVTFLQTFKQKNLVIKNNTIVSASDLMMSSNNNNNNNNNMKIKNDDLEEASGSEESENQNSDQQDSDEYQLKRYKSSSRESLFGNSKMNPKLSLMKSDYILLFILIVIIVITSILFVFIAIICIYTKYKKQFNKKRSPNGGIICKNNVVERVATSLDEEDGGGDDADNLHLATNRYLNKKVSAKKMLNVADLNSSASSASSQTNSDSHQANTKPQYTLVTNKSSSSSSSSCNAMLPTATTTTTAAVNNGTLIYNHRDHHLHDNEDDQFGLLSTMNRKIRDSNARYHQNNYQIKHVNAQQQMLMSNQRYLYSSLARANGYETHRSNSGNSGDSTTTTTDNSSSNDVNIIVVDNSHSKSKLSNLKLKTNQVVTIASDESPQNPHSSSSAYSSITNSDNLEDSSSSPTNTTSLIIKNKTSNTSSNRPDPNLLSFKKANHCSNVNSLNNYPNNRPTLRTSFNL